MMDEFCKCRFCKSYDSYEGCLDICYDHENYRPCKHRLMEAAKEKGISIADLVVLINMED